MDTDRALYVAAGADGRDLVTGLYDLAGCLQRGEPLVVPSATDLASRPIGWGDQARAMRAGQWRRRICRDQWPFRLFLVQGEGQDDEMEGAVRFSVGRVVAEEDGALLYGPLGVDVIAFATQVVEHCAEVEARLRAELGQTRPRASFSQIRDAISQVRTGEAPSDHFSPAAELARMVLGQVASIASRWNLNDIGLMFGAEAMERYASVRPVPSFRDLAAAGPHFRSASEVSRAILAVGLRDLLTPEVATAYFQRWTEVTGIAVP